MRDYQLAQAPFMKIGLRVAPLGPQNQASSRLLLFGLLKGSFQFRLSSSYSKEDTVHTQHYIS